MFALSPDPLDEAALLKRIENRSCGACVSFFGRVRSRNRGREVLYIEYEAAEKEARSEFEHIVAELHEKFDVRDVHCVHRIGRVNLGEPAVWVGVTSVHRSPAFAACQYVIDQLKKRLPIWKKEFYADGGAEWLGPP